MKAATRIGVWLVAAMSLAAAAPAAAQRDDTATRSAIAVLDKDAAHLRDLASTARGNAASSDSLSKAALAAAAKATDPAIRRGWENGAREHAGHIREQEQEAARLTAQADGKMAQSRKLKAELISPPTLALIADTLAPLRGAATLPAATGGADPKVTARARAILAKEKLLEGQRPAIGPTNIAQKLGAAVTPGTGVAQFLPELAGIHDALVRRDDPSLRQRVQGLYQKAGKAQPDGKALDTLTADARAAFDAEPKAMETFNIDRPDYTIGVRNLGALGKLQLDVTMKDGGDGQPARASFNADVAARPDATGKGLELMATPDAPETVTSADDAKLRDDSNGQWTDQDGHIWEISGQGNTVTLTAVYSSGHRVAYGGTWNLGKIVASHTINDPRDVLDLPGDVAGQLAATWHPPYVANIIFERASGHFVGTWTSETVTYSGMDHSVVSVQNPWDKPLVLTRGNRKFARGGRWPQDGP